VGSEKKPVYRMQKAPQYLSITLDGKCYGFMKKVSETTVNNVTEATFVLEDYSVKNIFYNCFSQLNC
ncbi:MAG: hypothetical protein IKT93_01605, partial [Clostridia bacterium]|nr:hypothetical protein [Clostridia bacterium]